ncbi:hypothetical protein Scep_021063 [Stephania cephalantha]|uniref:Uncharacterized protein n=1 Tax=Stephania cephalantha TaxID=152367 RepID=A0AAP0I1K4_9MAGN
MMDRSYELGNMAGWTCVTVRVRTFHDLEDQVFSPPLLMDTSLLEDSYEDLLAPLSETDTALMER